MALDSIQDPRNLGAIVRSASSAGAAGVIVTKDRSAPLTGTVEKTRRAPWPISPSAR